MAGFHGIKTASRVWCGIEVQYSEKYPASGESWTDLLSNRTTVIVRLEQLGGVCEPRLKRNEAIRRGRCDPGFFNWIPANRSAWCFADNVRCLRDLQLRFDLGAVESLVGNDYAALKNSEPLLMLYDARVTGCAKLLAEACSEEFRYEQLYGESLTVALITAIVNASRDRRSRQPASNLAPWQLRLAKEYLEQESPKNIRIKELVRLTGLSRSRLARGFKASTGLAPYTWSLKSRIERAKELLRKGEQPITAIALEVGFADQSHFTKAFKRLAGTSPAAWRNYERDRAYPSSRSFTC